MRLAGIPRGFSGLKGYMLSRSVAMSHLTVFVICFLAVQRGWGQLASPLLPDQCQIECFYQISYRPDSTINSLRTEIMRLQLGRKLSRFESKNSMIRDSVVGAGIANAISAEAAGGISTLKIDETTKGAMSTSFRDIIFKVPSANHILVQDRIGSTRYQYQEKTNLFSWTITPAKASIAGYSCQQARTAFGGRIWEAWFTRDVPIAEGPYKFYGLPGLILKVSDSRNHYVFELVKIIRPQILKTIALPTAGAKETGKEEFIRSKRAYEGTAMDQLIANGTIRFNTTEEAGNARQKARERAKKRNNPLELR